MLQDVTVQEAFADARAAIDEASICFAELFNGSDKTEHYDAAAQQVDGLKDALSSLTTIMARMPQALGCSDIEKLAAVKATEIEAALWVLDVFMNQVLEEVKGSQVKKRHVEEAKLLARPLEFLMNAFMILSHGLEQ
jgi:hypothetical protein